MTKNSTPKKTTKDEPKVIIDNTKLKLFLPWKKIEQEYNQVLKKAATKVKAQGFRQGKVPLGIAANKIGKERLINQVLDNLLPPQYQALIKKEHKQPLTPPEIKPLKMEWGKDWEFEIQIAEKPLVKLGEYKKSIKKGLKAAMGLLKKPKKKAQGDKKEPKLTKVQPQAKEREIKLHQIFKALIDDIKPQIPELLLKEETKRELHRLVQELEKIGLTLDDYLARRKQKFAELSSQISIQVLGQLQLEFVLEALEKAKKITLTHNDTQKELAKMKDKKMRAQIEKNPHYLDHLKRQIKRHKLLDALLDIS